MDRPLARARLAFAARQRPVAGRSRRDRTTAGRWRRDHPADRRHRDGAGRSARRTRTRWLDRSPLRPDGASAPRKLARGDRAAARGRGPFGRPSVDRIAEMEERPLRAASRRAAQARHLSRWNGAGRGAGARRHRALRVGSFRARGLEACRSDRAVRSSASRRRSATPPRDSALPRGAVTAVVSAREGTSRDAARCDRPRGRFRRRRCR